MNLLLIEDNESTAARRRENCHRVGSAPPVLVRLHRVDVNGLTTVAKAEYRIGALGNDRGGKASIGLKLLESVKRSRSKSRVVASTTYSCNSTFVKGVLENGFEILAELRMSALVRLSGRSKSSPLVRVSDLLHDANWVELQVQLPRLGQSVPCRAARLGTVELGNNRTGFLFAADVGAVSELHRGTVIAVSSDRLPMNDLIRDIWWNRWIRPVMRQKERSPKLSAMLSRNGNGRNNGHAASISYRSNITLAQKQDDTRSKALVTQAANETTNRRVLSRDSKILNLVELFAGAGGMGLGFLLAGNSHHRFRLALSAEIDPIYVQTLRANHANFTKGRRGVSTDLVPADVKPLNLRLRKSEDEIISTAKNVGGTDVLIGGPPCQGFSSANRNSWYADNPNNDLVNVFMRCVEKLRPKLFLMENVQGIVWTARNGRGEELPSVADHVAKRMTKAGYVIFPKLLDAVWYGVPQFRSRFFVLGIHRDFGYVASDFGDWGPFPMPTHGPGTKKNYVTVRDAIGDLPRIGNGHAKDEMPRSSNGILNPYVSLMTAGAPLGAIFDHVTSRHADYVLERYRKIPPGGNWQDIVDTMTNYAEVSRTHSNIYRRLEWGTPAITIGHYRKSMIVHPSQNRGLSLREACRLQSFPDWFRFAGNKDGKAGGLMHKQQQLANAVCPLVSKAIADLILEL